MPTIVTFRAVDHTYLTPGTYMAKVTVTDPGGGTGTASVEVIVADPPGNKAPTVRAAADPQTGDAPLDVRFSAEGSDPDGDTLRYEWDFGDGGKATTKDAMHTYNEVGVFYAKVTVSDGKGGKDSVLLQVNVQPVGDNSEEVGVGGLVPGVLALDITGSANFGTFIPGVAKDYTTSLAATVTSSASAAELTVRDPSANHTGHLVNGSSFLAQPLQVNATDQANPSSAFKPLSESGARVSLLAFPAPVSGHQLSIGFKQSIAANEPLVTGGYGKVGVFTLSPTTP